MSPFARHITPAILCLSLMTSAVPLMAKPNILPSDSAQHLPKLSPETVQKRKERKEQRATVREEKRLKRLRHKSTPQD